MKPQTDLYKTAGVDTAATQSGLRKIVERIKETWPPPGDIGAVKLDIGFFANVIDIGGIGLAICTDGVGSKSIIAQMMHRYDTIGIDCVAMNVNDLLCVGARPISLVDYIALHETNADMLDAIGVGLCEGARQAEGHVEVAVVEGPAARFLPSKTCCAVSTWSARQLGWYRSTGSSPAAIWRRVTSLSGSKAAASTATA